MGTVESFLRDRDIYIDCGDGLRKASIDEAIKYRERCYSYTSIVKNGKASPVIAVNAEKDVEWIFILYTAAYLVKAARSLGFNNTYIVFYWTGANVVINEESLPDEVFRLFREPINASIAISNYVLKNLENKVIKISRFFKGRIWFSTGLERILIPCSRTQYENKSCIYIDSDEIDNVLESELHNGLCVIGSPFNVKYRDEPFGKNLMLNIIKSSMEVKPMTIKASASPLPRVVGRFEIMSLLQAARYYVLTKDMDKAKSFGLNRAIFYAWAKYNRPRTRSATFHNTLVDDKSKPGSKWGEKIQNYVDDEVEVRGKYFVFGDQIQRPEDFEQVVARKIDYVVPFEFIWYLTLRYVKSKGVDILRDPSKFYKHVYEPVRDIYLDQLEKIIIGISKDLNADKLGKESLRSSVGEIRVYSPLKRITEYIKKQKHQANV